MWLLVEIQKQIEVGGRDFEGRESTTVWLPEERKGIYYSTKDHVDKRGVLRHSSLKYIIGTITVHTCTHIQNRDGAEQT